MRCKCDKTENKTSARAGQFNSGGGGGGSFPFPILRQLSRDHLSFFLASASLPEVWLIHKQRVLYDTSGGLRDAKREREREDREYD